MVELWSKSVLVCRQFIQSITPRISDFLQNIEFHRCEIYSNQVYFPFSVSDEQTVNSDLVYTSS